GKEGVLRRGRPAEEGPSSRREVHLHRREESSRSPATERGSRLVTLEHGDVVPALEPEERRLEPHRSRAADDEPLHFSLSAKGCSRPAPSARWCRRRG